MDPDIFAILMPHDTNGFAARSVRASYNKDRFLAENRMEGPGYQSASQSPQSCTTSDAGEDDDIVSIHSSRSRRGEYENSDRLVLRFSQPMINPSDGFQFGTDEKSDIWLLRDAASHTHRRRPSSWQFSMAVDENYSIWLHDYHSKYGTAVGYDGKCGEQFRRKATWILRYGPTTPAPWDTITLRTGGLAFKVFFPNHNPSKVSPEYMRNLALLSRRCRNAAPDLHLLNMETNSALTTATQSGTQSANNRPLYITIRKIGSGGFGDVESAVRARDGRRFAVKRYRPSARFLPLDRNITRRLQNKQYRDWVDKVKEEFDHMIRFNHPNLVHPEEYFEDDQGPAFSMPIFDQGSLNSYCELYDRLSFRQGAILLLGMLNGLWQLHSCNTIHRDIKPHNIMVKGEDDDFNILITDFGLAKMEVDRSYRSFCGTLKYMAPETAEVAHGYSYKADIWSAAICVMEAYIPEFVKLSQKKIDFRKGEATKAWLLEWANQLMAGLHLEISVSEIPDNPILMVLSAMLHTDPKSRCSAQEALELGVKYGVFRYTESKQYGLADLSRFATRSGATTPTPTTAASQQTRSTNNATSRYLHPERGPAFNTRSRAPAPSTVVQPTMIPAGTAPRTVESSQRYQGGASEGSLWWQDSNKEDDRPSRHSPPVDSGRRQRRRLDDGSPDYNSQFQLVGSSSQRHQNAPTDGQYDFDCAYEPTPPSPNNRPSRPYQPYQPESQRTGYQQLEYESRYRSSRRVEHNADLHGNPQSQESAHMPDHRQYRYEQRYDQSAPYPDYPPPYNNYEPVAASRSNQQPRHGISEAERVHIWGSVEDRVLKLKEVSSGRRSK